MVTPVAVGDPDDPRLADFVGLTDAELRRRIEGDRCFIAEGLTVVRRLLASPHRVRAVLVTPNRLAALAPDLDRCRAPVYVASRDVLQAVAGFDLHRGVVASADRPPNPDLADVVRAARTVAVLEGINDSENLGAIARSARALGVDALVLDPTTADPWARRTVRVSMGEILFLPVVRTGPVAGLLDTLRTAGFCVAALTPDREATDLWTWSRPPGRRQALVLGAEGPGLSRSVLTGADVRLRIPLRADVDSLNVGHAAAIAFAALVSDR